MMYARNVQHKFLDAGVDVFIKVTLPFWWLNYIYILVVSGTSLLCAVDRQNLVAKFQD